MKRGFLIGLALVGMLLSAGVASGAEQTGGYVFRWYPTGTRAFANANHWYTKTTTPDSTGWITVNPFVDSYDQGRIGNWVFPDSGQVLIEAAMCITGDSSVTTISADWGYKVHGTWQKVGTESLGTITFSDASTLDDTTHKKIVTAENYYVFAKTLPYKTIWHYKPDGIRFRGTGTAVSDSIHVREVQIRAVSRNR